jgi:guanylate kinase
LEQRLRGRATDDEDQIQRRMKVASNEMQQHELYDHTILSASRGEDFAALQKIYFAEKAKRA